MTTIVKEFEITSQGLMTGLESKVKCMPSNEKGIRFHVGNEIVEAKVENVIATDHCVVVGNQNVKVMLIEHFMAACAFSNIDSLDVYLSHYELPIIDGGSAQWIKLFGVNEPSDKHYTVKEPVYYENGKTSLVVLPSNEFLITYAVNFNHPQLSQKWVSFNNKDEKQRKEIVEARTFGYLKELETLQQMGFARGVTVENTLGLTDDGYTSTLKSDNEPIKHKILDIIGDFYLSQKNPLNFKANILVKEAGHAVHVNVCKMLKDKLIEI